MGDERVGCPLPGDRGIPRRDFLKGVAGGVLGLGVDPRRASADPGAPPDLVVVVLDALRASSLSVYGAPRRTSPFFEELAGRSALYSRCHAASCWTKPSVTSMLTGLPPVQHRDNRVASTLPSGVASFGSRLGAAGYRTGFFTANLILAGSYGAAAHFGSVRSVQPGRLNGRALMDEVDTWLGGADERPLCAYIHFFQPHAPYDPPPEFLERALEEALRVPPDPSYLADHHREVAMSPFADGDFGRLPPHQTRVLASRDPVDHLVRYEANVLFADQLLREFFGRWRAARGERAGVFFVTSDHGESLGEQGLFASHGKLLDDSLLHVPMVVHDTRRQETLRVDSDVSHLDLAPSLVRLAGLDPEPSPFGEPFLDGRPLRRERRRPALSQFVSHQFGIAAGAAPAIALSRGRWRLVYNEACGLGGANLNGLAGGAGPGRPPMRVDALPRPRTALRRPVVLTGKTALAAFALHTLRIHTGRALSYSGRIAGAALQPGRLSLRFRVGDETVASREEACAGAECRITGGIPALTEHQVGRTLLVEARWSPDGDDARGIPWRRLLAAPVHPPDLAGPAPDGSAALALLAVEVEPAVALPGDTLRIQTSWRCQQVPAEAPSIGIALHGPAGESLGQSRHPVLPSQLRAPEDLHRVFFPGFEFDQVIRVRLGADAPPGDARLDVSVDGTARAEAWPATRIVPDPAAAVAAADTLPLAQDQLRVLGHPGLPEVCRPGSGLAPPLARLATRFPDEGHLSYLHALCLEGGEARRASLSRCLEASPRHEAAGRARRGDPVAVPAPALDLRFGDCLRLSLAELYRGEASHGEVALLRLRWEALSPVRTPLAAELDWQGGRVFWFLGAGARPVFQWSVGEPTEEWVRLPVRTSGGELDAAGFLARASLVTTDWPGQPDWRRVESLDADTLHMGAWAVGSPDITTIEVPLEPGRGYRMTGLLRLRETCRFPTLLAIHLRRHDGRWREVETLTLQPGRARLLDRRFDVDWPAHLVLRYAMKRGAEDHSHSNLRIDSFRLQPPASAAQPDALLEPRLGVYPYWDMVFSGSTSQPFLEVRRGDGPARPGSERPSLGRVLFSRLPRRPDASLETTLLAPERFELLDLDAPPGPRRDHKADRPEPYAALRTEVESLLATLEAPEAEAVPELPSELRRQLEAIGYVE